MRLAVLEHAKEKDLMEIGKERKTIVIQPLYEPLGKPKEAPVRQPIRETEKVPVKVPA